MCFVQNQIKAIIPTKTNVYLNKPDHTIHMVSYGFIQASFNIFFSGVEFDFLRKEVELSAAVSSFADFTLVFIF